MLVGVCVSERNLYIARCLLQWLGISCLLFTDHLKVRRKMQLEDLFTAAP